VAVAQEPRTEVRAQARYVRTAPRKAQLVAEQIRGRTVPEARTILAFMTRDAARDVERVLSSAVANAEANHGLVGDDLYVSHAAVGAGPTLKRWRARARGRVARIRKRTCHITIALALPDEDVIPAPRPAPVAEPPAEDLPTEDAPAAKPRRAPGKKAEEAPAAEEKPKPSRQTQRGRVKPKAQEEPKAEKPKAEKPKPEKPKPKRTTTRKKKTEDS
jgi:large subunit ribosomal protein L22